MSWQIDTNHSHIQFSVRHMMISTVRGRFDSFTGAVEGDEQNPTNSRVEVQIEAASVDTRAPQRDADLRSANFLDVDNYPYITFKSTRIEQTDASHGRIVGDLTIRGVTREVVLDVEYAGQAKSPWGTTSAGFSATTKINRKDWGLTYNAVLETGGVMVGDEVTINIELELVKKADQAQEAGASA
jgi:polyisoprenoid-binding protein YceI